MLTKMGAIILLVADMKKSIEFYKDILELPLKHQSEEWTEFFSNGTILALHSTKKKEKSRVALTILVGFMVNDLDTAVKQLKEKKVVFFKEPREEPFGKHAIFVDPDEHLISIVQFEAKSAEGFDLLGLVGAE
ncbi:MAG TPA: VOC family protein [Candidatus Nitrosopolaris sp.]|nr:VOC family protein [Candidatus Nitrosopolaris sp.]